MQFSWILFIHAFILQYNAPQAFSIGGSRELSFVLSPDSIHTTVKGPMPVVATLTNQGKSVFRFWDGLNFHQPNQDFGEIYCELQPSGQIYTGWQKFHVRTRWEDPAPSDIVTLGQGASYIFERDLSRYYPLLEKGQFQIRAVFHPFPISGLKISRGKRI